jgi:hypothetical protein
LYSYEVHLFNQFLDRSRKEQLPVSPFFVHHLDPESGGEVDSKI